MAARPTKRFRIKEEASDSEDGQALSGPSTGFEGYNRDQEFWFADGNLILVVHDTAFRLYMGLLSAQSSVLSQLFSAAPISPDGGTEGAIIVRLPDSPHEWRYLLRRLMPKGSGTHKSTYDLRDDFPMISALLRLSDKYKITDVTQYAIVSLKTLFPESYNAWLDQNHGTGRGMPAAMLSRAVAAIQFARLFDIPSLLPTAFYRCACLGGAIVKGYTHADGTVEYLSTDDLMRCINGMQFLTAATTEYALLLRDYLPHPGKNCKKGGPGGACRALWKKEVKEKLSNDWHRVLGNHALRGVIETFPALSALCDACKKAAEALLEERRRKLWRDLPKMFDIKTDVGRWPAHGA